MKISNNGIVTIINTYKVHLLVFGIALFLILGCSLPKLFVNDECITTNQLSQLDQGHQVITNEGKYGTFENGTSTRYFDARSNGLGYSLFLPVISLPALKCINFFGNSFLFFLVEFWTILLIGIALFVREFFPEFTNSLRYKWTNITIIAAFVFLFCNLVFYKPFIFTGNRAYPEIAAIALTNAVLLAALSVLLFATYVTIFKSQRISVSATIISICCSSYLFWTITAKDHMLMAFLFGLLIYFGIKYIYTDEFWHVPAFFVVIGLIAWARAEIAVPLFLAFLILVIAQCVRVIRTKNNNKAEISLLLSPVFTIVGAIPFFVNNYYVTNNPLLPPYAVFNQNNAPSAGNLIASSVSTINTIGASVSPITTSHILVAGTVSPPIPQHALSQFFDTIIANYSIPPGTSIFNLLHLFFLPENRAAIIFIVCSIFLIGLALALLSKISWHDFSRPEKKVVFFLIINTIIIFFAYIHSWIWMSSDSAMIPDIRYFSPVYIPFSIMGIILIQKCGFLPVFSKKGLTVLMFSMGEIVVILVTLLILFKPRDISSQFYFATISETITCIAFALMMLCILAFVFNRDKQNRTEYCSLMLYAIVAAPSVWQLAVIFISSISVHPYGYTYWIPVVKTVMQHLQNFIV